MRPQYEVADVLDQVWDRIEDKQIKVSSWQLRILRAIKDCRTSALGGHIDGCTSCGHLQVSYNSCRNRHCPKCQGHKKEQWIQARQAELLPAKYYHVVFTLPQIINTVAIHKPAQIYSMLFNAAWATIQDFGKDPKWLGGKMGMVCILHTWGQNLSLHPHLHCIVPGVAIDKKGYFKRIDTKRKILFPVRALSVMFRGKMSHLLNKQLPEDFKRIQKELYKTPWVVYAKRPFGGPGQVIEYLGRYTHKIAISNHRIQSVTKDVVRFNYKDYRAAGKAKQMNLNPQAFIRRFSLHILPRGFTRIRHYGILSSTWKRGKLQEIQRKMNPVIPSEIPKQAPAVPPIQYGQCPCCKQHTFKTICMFDNRGPPQHWIEILAVYKINRNKINR